MLYSSNYFKVAHGNFGDDLNPWLWGRLAPEVCDQDSSKLFLGIGTVLSRAIPKEPIKVVFGSGCGTVRPPVVDSKWFFYAVRGPLSAAKMKLDPAMAITDSAVLIRRVVPAAPPKTIPVAFMPHHQSMFEADWEKLGALAGIPCIDPRRDVDHVLNQLQRTELLLTEAMHGAIVADALRVPWIALRLYGNFLEFKWQDWAQSLGIPLRVTDVPPVFDSGKISGKSFARKFKKSVASLGLGKGKWKSFNPGGSSEAEISQSLRGLERAAKSGAPMLSDENKLRQAEERLFEALVQLRAQWRTGQFKRAAGAGSVPVAFESK